MKKLVLKLELNDEREKRKALKTVAAVSGIDEISMDMKGKTLVVIGFIDPVSLVSKLRKYWETHIISVSSPVKEADKKEEGKKEPESKKEDEASKNNKKEEAAAEAATQPHVLGTALPPYYYYPPINDSSYYYVGDHGAEQNPNASCTIS